MIDRFNELVDKFNERAQTDEKLKAALEGKEKVIAIRVTDGATYISRLVDTSIGRFEEQDTESDIAIIADTETLTGILDHTIKPMMAFFKKKLKFDGDLQDILLIKGLMK